MVISMEVAKELGAVSAIFHGYIHEKSRKGIMVKGVLVAPISHKELLALGIIRKSAIISHLRGLIEHGYIVMTSKTNTPDDKVPFVKLQTSKGYLYMGTTDKVKL